jgi:hypothetical protein
MLASFERREVSTMKIARTAIGVTPYAVLRGAGREKPGKLSGAAS